MSALETMFDVAEKLSRSAPSDNLRGAIIPAARDELAEMRARLSRMDRLLRDVALSAVTLQDERIGYVEVQIDRQTWVFELALYRQNVGGE